MIKKNKSIPFLGIIFIIAVVLPGVLLSIMAIRAAGHEQAYLEKRLEAAYEIQIGPVVDSLNYLLDNIQSELDSTAPDLVNNITGNFATYVKEWRSPNPLIEIPFLFERTGKFLWPDSQMMTLSKSEKEFLRLHVDFFQNRTSAEIFQKIGTNKSKLSLLNNAIPASENFGGNDYSGYMNDLASLQSNTGPLKGLMQTGGDYNQFKVSRPSKQKSMIATPVQPYITESLKFSQIIAGKSSGFIPRIIDDRMILLYWRKIPQNRIIGCVINDFELKNLIKKTVAPVSINAERLLTVMDQNDAMILSAEEMPVLPKSATSKEMQSQKEKWQQFFVSNEIGERLPRWKVAVFLNDPDVINNRARLSAITLTLLSAVLLVAILTGGTLILRSLTSEIRLAQQKTTFVANVSHELKTPLTSIRLFAEMLREGRQPDKEKQQKYLDIMVSETERLTRLINNVLDFARQSRGRKKYDFKIIDIVPLIQELFDCQRSRLEYKGFKVSFFSAFENASVLADCDAIRQAMINILSNAEKYSLQEKVVDVSISKRGMSVVIAVSDHGIGIDSQSEPHLFEPFFRADDSLTSPVPGTGLGLTISNQIAIEHGGSIEYRKNEGGGSIFELHLPLRSNL